MKEKRTSDIKNTDPVFSDATFTYNNMLALPEELKTYLTDQGMDWRFLNAQQFRGNGNYHRSHWQPFKDAAKVPGIAGSATAEGLIQRGDLILGVRPKAITAKHKEFLQERNKRYTNFSKETAKELREDIRRRGISGVKVDEGYDEDNRGFKGGDRDED